MLFIHREACFVGEGYAELVWVGGLEGAPPPWLAEALDSYNKSTLGGLARFGWREIEKRRRLNSFEVKLNKTRLRYLRVRQFCKKCLAPGDIVNEWPDVFLQNQYVVDDAIDWIRSLGLGPFAFWARVHRREAAVAARRAAKVKKKAERRARWEWRRVRMG